MAIYNTILWQVEMVFPMICSLSGRQLVPSICTLTTISPNLFPAPLQVDSSTFCARFDTAMQPYTMQPQTFLRAFLLKCEIPVRRHFLMLCKCPCPHV